MRRTALYYGRDGSRYILVATAVRGGGDPAWHLNVLDNPAVVLQVGTEAFGALARPATAEERPRLWRLMTRLVPRYLSYGTEAGRELPIVVADQSLKA